MRRMSCRRKRFLPVDRGGGTPVAHTPPVSRVPNTARRRAAGFTLIELLVVLAILGLVTTIAVIQINSYWQRARLQAAAGDIRNFLQGVFTEAVNQHTQMTVSLQQVAGAWQLQIAPPPLRSPAVYPIPDYVSLAYNPTSSTGGWPAAGTVLTLQCDPRGITYVPVGYLGSAIETPGGTPALITTQTKEVKTLAITHTRMVDGSLTPNTRFDIQVFPIWNVSYRKVLL